MQSNNDIDKVRTELLAKLCLFNAGHIILEPGHSTTMKRIQRKLNFINGRLLSERVDAAKIDPNEPKSPAKYI